MARPGAVGSRAVGSGAVGTAAGAAQRGRSQLRAGCEMNQVHGEGSGCCLCCRAQRHRPAARLALPPPPRHSLNVLQNLAIGAGAVGSLQLTYISKVR